MAKVKYFLVSVDQCELRAVKDLTEEERSDVYCYSVNPKVEKNFNTPLKIVNEWELPWYDERYQVLQYYEYGVFAHVFKNPELVEGATHVGLLHYDVKFKEGSTTQIEEELEKNPNTIYYNTWRKNNQLFFTRDQFDRLCDWMGDKLEHTIHKDFVWETGWFSEALSITPVHIFKGFGEFLLGAQYEIEDMLNTNKWGLMTYVKHRPCGFVERLWGIYLMSLYMDKKMMPIIHEQAYYEHLHLKDKQNFLDQFK